VHISTTHNQASGCCCHHNQQQQQQRRHYETLKELVKSLFFSCFYDSDKLFVSIIDKMAYVQEVWNAPTKTPTLCAFSWNNET